MKQEPAQPFGLQATKEGLEKLAQDLELLVLDCWNTNASSKERHEDSKKRTLLFETCLPSAAKEYSEDLLKNKGVRKFRVLEQGRILSRLPFDLKALRGSRVVVRRGALYIMNTFLVTHQTCAVYFSPKDEAVFEKPATQRVKLNERQSDRHSENSNFEYSTHAWMPHERTMLIQNPKPQGSLPQPASFQPGFASSMQDERNKPAASQLKAAGGLSETELEELEELTNIDMDKEIDELFDQ